MSLLSKSFSKLCFYAGIVIWPLHQASVPAKVAMKLNVKPGSPGYYMYMSNNVIPLNAT